MKKLLSILIIVTLFLAIALPSSAIETKPDTSKAVKLKWYFPGTAQPEQDMVFEAVNKVLKDKINTTVEFDQVDWGAYGDKMNVMLAAGEPMDLCFTSNWMNNYLANVAKGAYQPLDDLITKYAPGYAKLVPAKIRAAAKVKGKTYGFINYQVCTKTFGWLFIKKYVDKYKFDINSVKKLQDLEPFFKKIKDNERGKTAFNAIGNENGMQDDFMGYLGYELVAGTGIGAIKKSDKNATVVNQYKTPEFKAFLNLMRDWYKKGYIRKNAASLKNNDAERGTDRLASGASANYKPGGTAEENYKNKATADTELVEVKMGDSYLSTGSIITTLHAVPIASEHADRAVMLMELLNTDVTTYNLLVNGIEDKHYKKVGANRIEPVTNSKYAPGNGWEFGCTFNAYLLPGQADTVWDDTKKMHETAIASPLMGFVFDGAPVKTEVAQVGTIIQQYMPSLSVGAVDVNKVFPVFLDKIEKAGAQKIVDEMQKQIKQWQAAK